MKFFRILALILTLALLPISASCSHDVTGINESGFRADISTEATNYVLLDITYTTSEKKEVTEKLVIELCPDIAPITVQNFKDLVAEEFYDGLTFHRVYKGFMIQGGDPDGNGSGGSSNTIKGEFASNGVENPLSHKRGVVSMARSDLPNSASSQFFIVHQDSEFLDGNYAAFGRVVYGMNVVDGIARTQTTYNRGGEKSTPISPVTINYARFVTVLGDALETQINSTIHSTVDLSTVEPSISTTTLAVTDGTSTPSTEPQITSTPLVESTTTTSASTSSTTSVEATTTTPTQSSETTPPLQPEPPIADALDFSILELDDYETAESTTNLVLLTVTYTDEYGAPQTGKIVFRLFPTAAPLTAAHFQSLVAANSYDGSQISRIVSGTALFGGITDCATVKGEFANNGVQNPLNHKRGIVSLMHYGNNDSATGEFVIFQCDYHDYDDNYAAFAFVAYGMDTVDEIAKTPLQMDPETFIRTLPVSPVTIVSTEFLTQKEA